MAWTTPITWTVGQIVGASDMNTQIRDNMNYLFASRPLQQIVWSTTADYTTTSTSPVDVDATNLIISATFSGTRALVFATGTLKYNLANEVAKLGVFSVGLGANSNAAADVGGATGGGFVSLVALFTGLSAVSQSFKMRFWTSNVSGTTTLVMKEGTGLSKHVATMTLLEV